MSFIWKTNFGQYHITEGHKKNISNVNFLFFAKYTLTDGKAKHFNPLLQQMLIVLIPANMQMQKHADTFRLIVNIQG